MRTQEHEALINAFDQIDAEGRRRILYSIQREAERCAKRRPKLHLVGSSPLVLANDLDLVTRKVKY